jgi:hypothetical protein
VALAITMSANKMSPTSAMPTTNAMPSRISSAYIDGQCQHAGCKQTI